MLEKVISGGQTGADMGGLLAARRAGIKTGGTISKGWRTEIGPRPDLAEFGLKEHTLSTYPPRTYQNVRDSDATIRLARDFSTAGEICTMKAILQYNRLHLDIGVDAIEQGVSVESVATWLYRNKIKTLNVAGNCESTYPTLQGKVSNYLFKVFKRLKELELAMPNISEWQKHKLDWKDCQLCDLCQNRDKIVLLRGVIPAEVLFIGEAPGRTENGSGQPFKGEAGHLLNEAITRAMNRSTEWTYALTNLVACMPDEDEKGKLVDPTDEQIKACEDRLKEIVRIVKPRVIVLVGKLSKKHVSGEAMFSLSGNDKVEWLPEDTFITFIEIIHPAAILRADESQKGLAYQKMVNALESISEALTPF